MAKRQQVDGVMSDAARFLKACITDLDDEIERKVDERARLLGALQLLGAVAEVEPERAINRADARDAPNGRAPRQPGAPRRSPVYRDVVCPDCGETKGSAAGLAQHRKHKHPASAANPIEPIPIRAPFDADAARIRAAEAI